MKQNFTWKRTAAAVLSFLALILFDQWSKLLAISHLKGKEPVEIIPGVFELHYLENKGAAFGMMEGKQLFFVVIALAAVLFVAYAYFKIPWEKRFHALRVLGIAIAGGAVGNLIDRIFRGYVVDFFYFRLINFPIFNVADIYVSVATAVLAVMILFFYKEEELERIFSSRKKEKQG